MFKHAAIAITAILTLILTMGYVTAAHAADPFLPSISKQGTERSTYKLGKNHVLTRAAWNLRNNVSVQHYSIKNARGHVAATKRVYTGKNCKTTKARYGRVHFYKKIQAKTPRLQMRLRVQPSPRR